MENVFLYATIGASSFAIIVAIILMWWVLSQPSGNKEMQKISLAIQQEFAYFCR